MKTLRIPVESLPRPILKAKAMTPSTQRWLVRDSLALLSLTVITFALFGITLLLFRSFESRRASLAKFWSDQGRTALNANRAAEAVTAYRTALSYAPGERDDELMLARALGEAGRIDESFNYFTGLWETRPGDGFVNLELARLEAREKHMPEAVNFYRAAVYGMWEGDSIEHRREARLELARYLIEQHQFPQAKTELLVAVGNAPDTPDLETTLGGLLEQVNDQGDALNLYLKALRHEPRNANALSAAGRMAYGLGKYVQARNLLERALREDRSSANDSLLRQTDRVLVLNPSENLPARERVNRILAARTFAKKRLTDCTVQVPGSPDGDWAKITARWTGPDSNANASALLSDPDRQKSVLQLIYDTELAAGNRCGAPAGDDALLLQLTHPAPPEPVIAGEASHQ